MKKVWKSAFRATLKAPWSSDFFLCFWFSALTGASIFQTSSVSTVILACHPSRPGFQREDERKITGWKGHIPQIEATFPKIPHNISKYISSAKGHTPSCKEGNTKMDFSWTRFPLYYNLYCVAKKEGENWCFALSKGLLLTISSSPCHLSTQNYCLSADSNKNPS